MIKLKPTKKNIVGGSAPRSSRRIQAPTRRDNVESLFAHRTRTSMLGARTACGSRSLFMAWPRACPNEPKGTCKSVRQLVIATLSPYDVPAHREAPAVPRHEAAA